ncbi:MAG: acetate--CoA ligase family protein [Syntrophorhabdaceae bacterium]|nr:acetate--CoA ligase family protein [Syntrophorhabdaceae bacterium]
MPDGEIFKELDPIFNPKGVALIGASGKIGKIGKVMMDRFLEVGFPKLYPVNPAENEISGIRAYPSILDIPYDVDLAIIVTPKEAVLKTVKECTEKKVRAIVITTSGFGEADEDGRKLQEEIATIAKRGGTRVIGPNCIGIYCPESRLPYTLKPGMEPGNVGVVSQSGFFADYLTYTATRYGINFSKAVSCGNECDLTITDFLEYMGEDPKTEIIIVYVEGVKDGRRFVEVLRHISRKKPIILWKGGTTEGGSKAAASHTGAVSGSHRIWDGVIEQTGVIRVKSFEETIDTLIAFNLQPLPEGNRVGIISAPGGMAVATTDACFEMGLDVPDLSQQSLNRLKEIVPSVGGSIKNPVDLSLASLVDPEIHGKALRVMDEEERIDMLLLISIVGGERLYKILFEGYGEKPLKKPLAVTVMEDDIESFGKHLSYLCKKGISPYPDASRATKALSKLWSYGNYRKKAQKKGMPIDMDMPLPSALGIIEKAIGEGRSFLSEHESKMFLNIHGIPITREEEVCDEKGLKEAIKRIGFPIAIKAGGKSVPHKSEHGLVYLDIGCERDALFVFHEITKKRTDKERAVLVQEMVKGKRELIVGLIRDRQFGPSVMFGLGGIFTEILKDHTFRVAPLDMDDAYGMIEGIRSKAIMEEIRGMARADKDEIARILITIGQIGLSYPEIMEIDINPFIISDGKGVAVDALIVLKGEQKKTLI